jgi:hypothetical protein
MIDKSDFKNIKNYDRKNQDKQKKKVSLKTIVLKGLLFIFCAIPGLFLFLIYSLWVAASIFAPKMENPPLLLTPVLMATGIVLMLIGTGKLKEFKYSAVFLFIPISFIIYGFLAEWKILGSKTVDIVLFVAVILFFVNSLIIMHYQKKRKRNGTNSVAPSDTNRPQEKKE